MEDPGCPTTLILGLSVARPTGSMASERFRGSEVVADTRETALGRRPRRRRLASMLGAWCAVALLSPAGCATRRLVPAQSDSAASAPALSATQAGVTVVAAPQAWKGARDVPLELTPVHLTIRNEGEQPVYVSRTDIVLVGSERQLRALSPALVDVRPVRTSLGLEPSSPLMPPPVPPAGNAFAVDRPTGDLSPGNQGLTAPHFNYREPMVPHGVDVEPNPREQMMTAALPQGAVDQQTMVSGFVYFDRLRKTGERLDLRVTVREHPGGPPLTTLSIPFRVER